MLFVLQPGSCCFLKASGIAFVKIIDLLIIFMSQITKKHGGISGLNLDESDTDEFFHLFCPVYPGRSGLTNKV